MSTKLQVLADSSPFLKRNPEKLTSHSYSQIQQDTKLTEFLYAAEVKVESTENQGQILIAMVESGVGWVGQVHQLSLSTGAASLSLLILTASIRSN